MFSLKDITTITLTLFAIIDIIGGLPVIISIKNSQKYLDSGKATLTAGGLTIAFLLVGEILIKLVLLGHQIPLEKEALNHSY
jgi:multiple antibiotic resistance protein